MQQIQLAVAFGELLLQIRQGLQHKLQTGLALIGMRLDLLRVKDKRR